MNILRDMIGANSSGRGQTRPRIETQLCQVRYFSPVVAAGVKPGRGLKQLVPDQPALCRWVAAGVKPGRGLKPALNGFEGCGERSGRGQTRPRIETLSPRCGPRPAAGSGRGQTRPRIETRGDARHGPGPAGSGRGQTRPRIETARSSATPSPLWCSGRGQTRPRIETAMSANIVSWILLGAGGRT